MLMPKRVKRRKQFRDSIRGKATRGNKITYGEYGIVALEPCWIKSNQIEAARIAMTRYIKRGGQGWKKIFQANVSKKQAHIVILTSNKIDFKGDEDKHFTLIKEKHTNKIIRNCVKHRLL